jgi:hypothetical protein
MGQIERQEDILSETEAGHVDSDSLKLVPVAESIRYRKRAQSAEKQVEALSGQLAEARSEACEMAEQLRGVRVEQELTQKLAAAGTVDLETAVLIAKARMEAEDGANSGGVIERLKREKPHLFGKSSSAGSAIKTAGAKDRMTNRQTILERAAKKAAATGNRADLQEYLKLRRDFV